MSCTKWGFLTLIIDKSKTANPKKPRGIIIKLSGGYPGSGKTFIEGKLKEFLESYGENVCLVDLSCSEEHEVLNKSKMMDITIINHK